MKSTRVFRWLPFSFAAGLLSLSVSTYAAAPVVSNVRASQRTGTKLVDIYYDVADADSTNLTVSVAVSTNGGVSYFWPGASVSGVLGAGIAPGSNEKITWNAGVDLPAKLFSNVRVSVTAWDDTAPSGMALIPAGSFAMGDSLNDSDDSCGERPVHSVHVSAFYMDNHEVTKTSWDEVYNWAITHGYSFQLGALGKTNNHPAHVMTWYGAVKWCNARSEKEGHTPAYYTSAAQTVVYRSGQVDVDNRWVKWNSGYRLPTEAEWEKAARGGASGQRFPWGGTISWSQANYSTYPLSAGEYAYDLNPVEGHHPTFATGDYPYTNPVGYFTPNGYGLYDMAGNVCEWCWDWYGSYSSASQTDPRGPTSGSSRVYRGGGWENSAVYCRVAARGQGYPPDWNYSAGFRSVLPSGQPEAISSAAFSPIFTVDTRAVEQPGSVAVRGRVVNSQGAGLAEVRVSALQNFSSFTGATTDATGNYQLPALAPGVWELWAMKDGYVTGVRSGLALAAGQSTTCNFTLATVPPLTNVSAVNREIEASQSARIVPVTNAQLKVFVSGTFTTGTVDRSKPTVIFTHGWNSDPTVWAEAMAGRMAGLTTNLLAWDWQTQAVTLEPVTAMARTRRQGEALGKALFEALGTDYTQSLHFIGHSLGTLVNASAANYLHWRHLREQFPAFGYERTHITLLDDAGGVSKLGKAVTFDYTVTGMDGSLANSVVENGYVSPVPDDATWVDNYYSFVGKRHPQAVNVLLPKAVVLADRTNPKVFFEQVHRYPCNWYAMTVLTPTQCLLGHRYALERSGLATAFPTPSPYPLGTDLSQDLNSNFELDLVELKSPLDWSEAENYQAAFGIPAAGFSAIQWAAQGSVNLLSAGVQKVGNVVESVSESLSSFAVTQNGVPVYSETADSTTMYYLPEGTELQTEVRLSPRFQLTVPTSKPNPMPRVAKDGGPGDSGSSNGPPAVWMSVAVPSNTLGMAFNFILISGDTNDDYLAFGINGTNVFALETRFMPAGQVLSSGMIDISAYAGQSVEFFFGVLGGNSTNTTVAVDGIRFYQEARPALSVASSGNEVRLLWPITRNAYVLETATALAPVADWKQMTNVASLAGLENVVTNTLSPGSMFFRLRQVQ